MVPQRPAVTAAWLLLTLAGPLALAESQTLAEGLEAMDRLRKGRATPFNEVEAAAQVLLRDFPSPEEHAEINYQLAAIYAQSGPKWEEAIRYAKAALDLPLPLEKKLQMYVYWGDCVQVSHAGARGADLAAARRDAAKIYLRGLKACVDNAVPKTTPEVSGSAVINSTGETDPKLRQEIKAQQAKQKEARDNYWRVRDLILCRETLMRQMVSIYSLSPFDTDELRRTAKESLGDDWLADELIKRTQIKIGQRLSKLGASRSILDRGVAELQIDLPPADSTQTTVSPTIEGGAAAAPSPALPRPAANAVASHSRVTLGASYLVWVWTIVGLLIVGFGVLHWKRRWTVARGSPPPQD